MSKHVEGHKTAMDRLREMTTVGEILETAMSFEKAAELFYTDLAPKVSKPLRELVQELADEEKEHFSLFDHLVTRPDAEHFFKESIKLPEANHKFSEYVETPKLGAKPDDQTILQYAMGRERAAADHYGELAKTAPEGPIRDLFIYLSEEELRHKGELEKRYYEIVHSGGV